MNNDDKNKNKIGRLAFRLLEEHLTRGTVKKKSELKRIIEYGSRQRDLPDELEKQLRIKTIEKIDGKKATYPALSKKQ